MLTQDSSWIQLNLHPGNAQNPMFYSDLSKAEKN